MAGRKFGSPPGYFYPYESGNRALLNLQTGGHEGEYLTDRLTDEAIAFLEANADDTFFLYLSHYAVHTPIRAKEEIIQRYRDKPASGGHHDPVYAAMVASVDEGVGRIMATLDELGLTDNTVVVFYSDNGGVGPVTSMAPLRGSKGMLYEGGIREPLIVRWPGHIEPGTTIAAPVIGVDFYPTLLDIAGADAPAGHVLDGVTLMPLLTGIAEVPERPLFRHFPAYLQADRSVEGPWRTTPVGAMRFGSYKLMEFFEDGRLELYNLDDDIGEQHDLAAAMPEKTSELHEMLRAWRESVGAPVPTEPNPAYRPAAARSTTLPAR